MPTTKKRHRSSRILVVDDEKIVREVVRSVLDRPGMFLIDAEDGEQAIGLLLEEPFDVLICDKNLPGITGLDVLRRAKAVDRTMGTLLITAYASEESANEAMALGIDDYIIKPFDLTDLENKVLECIERRVRRLGAQRTAVQAPRQVRGRVLVLDRNDNSRAVLLKAVETLGHKPVEVSAISAVLEAVRAKDVHALICDLNVLNQDDAAACFLRSTLLVSQHLPFVVVANEDGLGTTVQAIHRGAQKILVRPLGNQQTIAEILQPLLGKAIVS